MSELPRETLERWSGYKRTSDQARWLRDHGIPFALRRDGQPILTQRVAEEAGLAVGVALHDRAAPW